MRQKIIDMASSKCALFSRVLNESQSRARVTLAASLGTLRIAFQHDMVRKGTLRYTLGQNTATVPVDSISSKFKLCMMVTLAESKRTACSSRQPFHSNASTRNDSSSSVLQSRLETGIQQHPLITVDQGWGLGYGCSNAPASQAATSHLSQPSTNFWPIIICIFTWHL